MTVSPEPATEGNVLPARRLRRRLAVECLVALASAVFLGVTLLWHDWIEIAFGVDPDGGSGALERLVAVFLTTTAAAFTLLARMDRRRWQAWATRPEEVG